jgi:hypothetical protein
VARPSAPRPRRRPGAGAIGRVMRLWSQCRSRPHSPPHSPPQPPPGQKDDGEGMEWGEGRGAEDPSSVGVGRCAGEGRRCRAADPKAAEPRPSRRPASRPAAPAPWRLGGFRGGASGRAWRSRWAAGGAAAGSACGRPRGPWRRNQHHRGRLWPRGGARGRGRCGCCLDAGFGFDCNRAEEYEAKVESRKRRGRSVFDARRAGYPR